METKQRVNEPAKHSQRLETKYRDIADGNLNGRLIGHIQCYQLETKYRDIADGHFRNLSQIYSACYSLAPTYRDIADGNSSLSTPIGVNISVGNQVPRYSGWKPLGRISWGRSRWVGNPVPRYSGWKLPQHLRRFFMLEKLETKHRKIADRTVYLSPLIYKQRSCRASRFLNAQRHHPCTPPPTAWSDWAKPNKQARLDNLKSSSITILIPPVRSIKRQSSQILT